MGKNHNDLIKVNKLIVIKVKTTTEIEPPGFVEAGEFLNKNVKLKMN